MRKKGTLLSIILFTLYHFSLGQTAPSPTPNITQDSVWKHCNRLIKDKQYQAAAQFFNQNRAIFPNQGAVEQTELYHNIGKNAWNTYNKKTKTFNTKEALIWWRDSTLQKRINLLGTQNINTIKTMYGISSAYQDLGRGKEQLETTNQIIDYVQQGLDPLSRKDSSSLASKFSQFSKIYRKIEDFNKAELCLNKAKYLTNANTNPNLVATINENFGILYNFKGEQEKAKHFLLKSIAVKLNQYRQYNLAHAYYQLNQLDSAQFHCQAAKDVFLEKKDRSNLARASNLLGLISKKRGDYPQALNYLQQSVDIVKNNTKKKKQPNNSLVIGYENIADVYFQQGKEAQALQYYQRALTKLVDRPFLLPTVADNPLTEHIGTLELNEAIRILGLKINALYYSYQKDKQREHLEIALQTATTVDTLVRKFRLFNKSGEDKVTLSETVLPYYESSILVANELYQISQDAQYLDRAYQALLNIKGIVLLEEIKAKEVLYALVPPGVIKKETKLREAIYQLENILSVANETEKVAVSQKHFEAKIAYEQFLKKIERLYPDYYHAKFDYETTNSLSELQTQIEDQALMFDFLEGTQALYLFGISKKQLSLVLLSDKTKLDSSIQKINQTVNLTVLHQESRQLYDLLIKPLLTKHQEKFERLIFVKSGFLHNLAFDLLRTDEQDYLINKYKLCELYSAKQLLQEKKYSKKDNEYLGFAINYQGVAESQRQLKLPDASIYLNQLNAVTGEIQHGGTLFRGKTYFNEQVSTQKLRQSLGHSSNIIHFSMHAISSPEALQSGLIIYDQDQQPTLFNKNDIMAHRLNNELTILSACQTGAGKKYKGEGVMSLARAFFNAGSQSVLVSTNSAADHSSQQIMSALLDYIKMGKSKDEALQLAKKSYLAEAPPAYQHPKYWAYFSIIGNTDPISFSAPNWTNYLVILVSLLLVAAGLFRYQQIQRRRSI